MTRLVAVSNRTATAREARAGGLAVAIWDALAASGGVWFGWSGETVADETRGMRVITDEGVTFGLADLTQAEYDGYYLGYANQALWPVCHYRVDLANFREAEFEAYEGVNRRFARLIAPQLKRDDVVWAHDYHFLLLGEALRREGWDGPLGFFLHIPFPAPEMFRALPEHARLARGLVNFDLLGFQTERDAANFRRYLEEELDAETTNGDTLTALGRRLRAAAFPIGIDAAHFRDLADSAPAKRAAARITSVLGDQDLVIGVDRMDYSKGLPERFAAIEQLFHLYPDLRGRVSFTQIAPPSRSDVEEYADLRLALDQLVGRVNGDFGDLDWTPIRYLARSFHREELAGLYRAARVGLVTPLRDGMNLVAKEYVAAQDPEDPGVLVLSQFAGAAEQLEAAVLVNPYDQGALADAVRAALHMPVEERRRRWETLYGVTNGMDVAWWRREFLNALSAFTTPNDAGDAARGPAAKPTPA